MPTIQKPLARSLVSTAIRTAGLGGPHGSTPTQGPAADLYWATLPGGPTREGDRRPEAGLRAGGTRSEPETASPATDVPPTCRRRSVTGADS